MTAALTLDLRLTAIRDWLATKEPTEPAGLCSVPTSCVIANYLLETTEITHVRVLPALGTEGVIDYSTDPGLAQPMPVDEYRWERTRQQTTLPRGANTLADRFDRFRTHHRISTPTNQEVLELIDSLLDLDFV